MRIKRIAALSRFLRSPFLAFVLSLSALLSGCGESEDDGDAQATLARTLAAALPARPVFDCEAYWNGEISEPIEMTLTKARLVEFTAITKSGRQITFTAASGVPDAYARAEAEARRRGYELRLSSSPFRSFEDQVSGYCAELEHRGFVVQHAYPGRSTHRDGGALDVYLFRNGRQLNAISWHETPTEDEEALRSIMEAAGFVRGKREQWHFEYRAN